MGACRPSATLTAATLTSVFALVGCIPKVEEHVVTGPPQDVGAPIVKHEERATPDHIVATVNGDVVTATVTRASECRTVTRVAQEHQVTKERKLSSGTAAQIANAVVAAGLIGAGAYVAANPPSPADCTPNATSSDPNPQPGTCTADQYNQQKSETVGIGVVIIGGGALAAAAFGWNIFRAQDETTAEPLPPTTRMSDWQACGVRPATGVEVTLTGAGQPLRVSTDENGVARFDLSPVQNIMFEPTKGEVATQGSTPATVSLTDTPLHARWAKDDAARSAALQRELQARQEQYEALKGVVMHLDSWARSSIRVQWATTNHSETHCFNRVDFEVPCTSEAAFRKEDNFSVINQATVSNGSKVAMVCGQSGDWLGNGKTFVQLGPGRTTTLPAVESAGLGLVFAMFGGGNQNTVVCALPTATASHALGVDASLVTGQGSNLVIGIVGGNAYGFMSDDKNNQKLYMMDGGNLVVK